MAFTGAATVTQVSDKKVLITGLSLAASAAGTISLAAGAGDVKTATSFDFNAWKYLPSLSAITRAQGIRCTIIKRAVAPAAAGAVVSVASGADTDAAFLLTLTNIDAGNASGALDIWLENMVG